MAETVINKVVKANESIKTMDDAARALNLKRCIDQLMPEKLDPDFEICKRAFFPVSGKGSV